MTVVIFRRWKATPFLRVLNIRQERHVHLRDDDDHRTTVSVLNRERGSLLINSFSSAGFSLNNGVHVQGSIALFCSSVLAWRVKDISHITPASLSLFHILEPRLDCLIIGTGERAVRPSRETLQSLQARRITCEVLSTENAVSTFNYLNFECRSVAAVLMPPARLNPTPVQRMRQERLARESLLDGAVDPPVPSIEGR